MLPREEPQGRSDHEGSTAASFATHALGRPARPELSRCVDWSRWTISLIGEFGEEHCPPFLEGSELYAELLQLAVVCAVRSTPSPAKQCFAVIGPGEMRLAQDLLEHGVDRMPVDDGHVTKRQRANRLRSQISAYLLPGARAGSAQVAV
jgi:hypothetical protein